MSIFKMLKPGKPDQKLLIPGNPEDLTPEQEAERLQVLEALNQKVNIFFKPDGEYSIEPTGNKDEYKLAYHNNEAADGKKREIPPVILSFDSVKNVLNKTIPTMIAKESMDPITKKLNYQLGLELIITKTRELLLPQILNIKGLRSKQGDEPGYELTVFERIPGASIKEKDKTIKGEDISDEEAVLYYPEELLESNRNEKFYGEKSIRKALADIWSENIK